MIHVHSEYYEKDVTLSDREINTLYELYLAVAKEQGFTPELESADDLATGDFYDHVAYHVDYFAKDKKGYDIVAHLFVMEEE